MTLSTIMPRLMSILDSLGIFETARTCHPPRHIHKTCRSFVRKQKIGKTNFFINEPLFALLSGITLRTP